MKLFAFLLVFISGGLLIFTTLDFPAWGDPSSPASSHVSPHYIEQAIDETAVPNLVTAVLADYRGYDTMLETTVIFVAGVVCFYLLRTYRAKREKVQYFRHTSTNIVINIGRGGRTPADESRFEPIDSTWAPYDLITKTTCRLLMPFIQLFALYVIAHGHHSPGGGFQGGVILGASFILYAISYDLRRSKSRFGERSSTLLSAVGVFVFAGTGALSFLFGAAFLNYGALAPLFYSSPVMAHSHGMLLIEIGVGIAVMAVMIWIYYNISSQGKHEEGL